MDVLLLENIVINYFILLLTAKISKNKTSNLRLLLGSFIGASYVLLLIICPNIKIYYTAFAKIILSLVIIAVVFSVEKIKEFLKIISIFYISTFIFAGAAFAFLYINRSDGIVKNGIIYIFWNSDWIMIMLSIIVVGIILKVLLEFFQYRLKKEPTYCIYIYCI